MTPRLPQGLPPETPLRGLPLAVWDLETTGLDPWEGGARILQVAVVHHVLGEDVPSVAMRSMVDPCCEVPVAASRVHGITTERLAELRAAGQLPGWGAVWPAFRDAVGRRVSAGYNLAFDVHFIRQAQGLPRSEEPPLALDAMLLAHRVLPGLRRYRLVDVAAYLGVQLDGAHDAGADALATAHVLGAMLPLLERCGLGDLGSAVEAQEGVRTAIAARYAARRG